MLRALLAVGLAVVSAAVGRAGGGAEKPSVASAARDGIAAVEAQALAAKARHAAKPGNDYRLAPGDLIAVTVYGDQELNRKIRVGRDGNVSMPLVGAIKVGGSTALGAQAAISAMLKRYYLDPQVSLFIEEYGIRQIYVL